MTKKSNLSYYRELLDIIEQEFGLTWLTKKVKKSRQASSSNAHPIPKAWLQAKETLDEAERTKVFGVTPEMATLFDMATYLRDARDLPNYSCEINPPKLKNKDFLDSVYVAQVASIGRRSGFEVEFIPPSKISGQVTPDLMMRDGLYQIEVECKRKNAYHSIEVDTDPWKELQDELLELQSHLQMNHEVIVYAISSLAEKAIPEIKKFAQELILNKNEGLYSSSKLGSAILLQEVPPHPPNVEGIWLPATHNPGAAEGTVTVDEQGRVVYNNLRRASLYVIDSHKFTQILSSFNTARQQLTPDSIGVIFIHVDMSQVREHDRSLYFELVSSWLKERFTPTANTRIAAAVLTADPEKIEITSDKGFFRSIARLMVVRNPYHGFPKELTVPGEKLLNLRT
jgi:hypothetical protein